MSISWLPQWRPRLCSASTVLVVAVSAGLGAGLTVAAPTLERWLGVSDLSAPPEPVLDSRFVTLGKTYLPELGKAYATAWNEGAKSLEAGQPVAEALKSVSQSWDSGRVQLFDRLITPELAKIVADGKPESDVKADNRQALAKAWRGFAAGLASSRRWW
jgi:hypothetical protein